MGPEVSHANFIFSIWTAIVEYATEPSSSLDRPDPIASLTSGGRDVATFLYNSTIPSRSLSKFLTQFLKIINMFDFLAHHLFEDNPGIAV
jgi:hypothetical protein